MSEITLQIKLPVLEASDALRPVLSSGEHKYYVLPLLFLRLLPSYVRRNCSSDVNEHVGSENLRQIELLLRDIDTLFRNIESIEIGPFVNEILARVETCFSDSLSNVFLDADFCSRRLGYLEQRESILSIILQSFTNPTFDFYLKSLQNSQLGEIFNSAIGILASQSRDGGEYVTPPEIATLIGRLVATHGGRDYYDPACGSGSLLSACGREARLLGPRVVSVGQEKNGAAWAIAKMNLFLSGLDESTVILGDSLRFPPITDEGSLRLFDIAVSNPPWNMKDWGVEFAKSDPYRRFELGVPSKSNGDYAFILHMLAVLKRTSGQLAIIVSNGTLSKSGGDGVIRRRLVESNLVDAVIALPQKLFFNTNIAANIFILRYGRIDKEIFFVDAGDKYFPHKNRNQFSEEEIDHIADLYVRRRDIDGFARSVSFDEIFESDFDLSVGRYISKVQIEKSIDLPILRARRREIEGEINKLSNLLEHAIREAEQTSDRLDVADEKSNARNGL